MKFTNALLVVSTCGLLFTSCKKDDKQEDTVKDLDQQILTEFSSKIASASYNNLAIATIDMHQDISAFRQNPTSAGLTECRNDWKEVRKIWESTEAYLFGPAATENIDPRIDTWPVNFNDLENIINGTDVLDEAYINNLDDALKGFHPAEYLLFGLDGNKSHLDFTARELEFLEALSANLKTLVTQLSTGWNPGINGSFYHEFANAGSGSNIYTTKKSAFIEMVSAMAGICDEVANGKIAEPFLAMDPSLEESPYSQNSITDFTNNMKGVQNVYLGFYAVNGNGLEEFVKQHNLSLDAKIKSKINAAITSLENITDPFGEAIFSQPVQVQNAIDAINDLQSTLDDELLPLVHLHIH